MPQLMPQVSYFLLVTLAAVPLSVSAQLVEEYIPPHSTCCLLGAAQNLVISLEDWNGVGRYYDENARLKSQSAEPGRVVFFGDSITDNWKLANFFGSKPYVNRGISGQVTSQMLVRVYPDVIDLKPAVMVLLAGTNDIAGNNGPSTLTMIEENIMAITELAKLHGIRVVLCSLTPIADYGHQKMSEIRPPSDILRVNTWLKEYAAKSDSVYADYFSALVEKEGNDKGMMKAGISSDGLHPNERGYNLMVPVVQAAIDLALKK
jgi:lysophospholipase L1-like esterase